jgi:hypothetical protein
MRLKVVFEKTAFVKFEMSTGNNLKQNFDKTDLKQPKVHMDFKNLMKKIREP